MPSDRFTLRQAQGEEQGGSNPLDLKRSEASNRLGLMEAVDFAPIAALEGRPRRSATFLYSEQIRVPRDAEKP